MKLLLSLGITCLITSAAQAQTDIIELQKLNSNSGSLPLLRDKVIIDLKKKDSLISLQHYQLFLKGVKPGVHRLPQDGMPCIVPDTKDIAVIPNLFKGKVSIPFAGNRPRIPNTMERQLFATAR